MHNAFAVESGDVRERAARRYFINLTKWRTELVKKPACAGNIP